MASGVKSTKSCLSLFLALVLMASVVSAISRQNQLEVLSQLKRLNKPVVKSIKSSDGDIIDCVKLSDQPAFDHPLLKNHTIQLSPTIHPERGYLNESTQFDGEVPKKITQLWQLSGSCPEGTIPIRRTKKSDILRASSAKTFSKKKQSTLPQPWATQQNSQDEHEYAIAYVAGDEYYGTKAVFNVWNPYVRGEVNEFSLSQTWLTGKEPYVDVLEAGWHVYPRLNGDNRTRFFTYWTNDGYVSKGCHNLQCEGFVQTNKKIVLGGTISPVSTYSGTMYGITITIWKDPNTKNWWLKYGNENVGYWPVSLFTSLAHHAFTVQWGREIINEKNIDGRHTTTQMGSGRIPDEGAHKASFIGQIQVVDASSKLGEPSNIVRYAGQPHCYNVTTGYDSNSGAYIYFGGPGRSRFCH